MEFPGSDHVVRDPNIAGLEITLDSPLLEPKAIPKPSGGQQPVRFMVTNTFARLVKVMVEDDRTPFRESSDFYRNAAMFYLQALDMAMKFNHPVLTSGMFSERMALATHDAVVQEDLRDRAIGNLNRYLGDLINRMNLGEMHRALEEYYDLAGSIPLTHWRDLYLDEMDALPSVRIAARLLTRAGLGVPSSYSPGVLHGKYTGLDESGLGSSGVRPVIGLSVVSTGAEHRLPDAIGSSESDKDGDYSEAETEDCGDEGREDERGA